VKEGSKGEACVIYLPKGTREKARGFPSAGGAKKKDSNVIGSGELQEVKCPDLKKN